jgi:large subunit ribosomal protein L24
MLGKNRKKKLEGTVHMRIKKGDTVIKISGVGKGKTGRVLMVNPSRRMVIVEGMNMVKRHTKAGRKGQTKGGIVEKEAPISVSNVMLVVDGEATRVGYARLSDGSKSRVARKTGENLS